MFWNEQITLTTLVIVTLYRWWNLVKTCNYFYVKKMPRLSFVSNKRYEDSIFDTIQIFTKKCMHYLDFADGTIYLNGWMYRHYGKINNLDRIQNIVSSAILKNKNCLLSYDTYYIAAFFTSRYVNRQGISNLKPLCMKTHICIGIFLHTTF